jgi:transcriptional regulator of NAD metabolism
MQCRLSIETRTTAAQIRNGEFNEDQLSVYVTARRYGGLPRDMTFLEVLDKLARVCDDMVEHYVCENILQPLARAISAR